MFRALQVSGVSLIKPRKKYHFCLKYSFDFEFGILWNTLLRVMFVEMDKLGGLSWDFPSVFFWSAPLAKPLHQLPSLIRKLTFFFISFSLECLVLVSHFSRNGFQETEVTRTLVDLKWNEKILWLQNYSRDLKYKSTYFLHNFHKIHAEVWLSL